MTSLQTKQGSISRKDAEPPRGKRAKKNHATFKTADGQLVMVRRMLPADINHLVDIYRHLSEESLYQRFREPAANLSPLRILQEARALAEAGSSKGKGFLAFVDTPEKKGVPIAGARYIRLEPDVAEAAITVRDDFQKKGVGAHLLDILIAEMRQDGIRKLLANTSATNSAVIRMLNHTPYPQKREHFGPEISIELDLTKMKSTQPDAT